MTDIHPWDDNPEWTEEDFARARPSAEVLPADVLAAFGRDPPSTRRAIANQGPFARLDQLTSKKEHP